MLKLEKVNIRFGSFALKNVDFEVKRGEYHVLLGPSGAGKSVLLNIIAGFKRPESGKVFYKSNDITGTLPQKRGISLLFQELALFPHMNVYNNVAFPLKIRKFKSEQIRTEVIKYLGLTGIEHLKDRQISDLSGGEKQRVAIARCLVTGSDLILLDEPLTAVDVQLRSSLKKLLKEIQALGKTIIHVTHDLKETKILADRISVINDGEIISSGTYNEVFSNPDSFFTASFNEGKNYFEVNSCSADGNLVMINHDIQIQLNFKPNKIKGIYINPKSVNLNNQISDRDENKFSGKVKSLTVCENGIEVEIDAGFTIFSVYDFKNFNNSGIKPNGIVIVSFSSTDVKLIEK